MAASLRILVYSPTLEESALDQRKRQLLAELRAAGVDATLSPSDAPPPGAKGDSVGVQLAVATVSAALPELIRMLRSWLFRQRQAHVKVTLERNGRRVEIGYEAADEGEMERLLETAERILAQ